MVYSTAESSTAELSYPRYLGMCWIADLPGGLSKHVSKVIRVTNPLRHVVYKAALTKCAEQMEPIDRSVPNSFSIIPTRGRTLEFEDCEGGRICE